MGSDLVFQHVRMSMRRFTRLTNAFSKKVENHAAAIALYFMFYNFGRVHQTLRVTPAMEAGVSDHVWTVAEIVGLLPQRKVIMSASEESRSKEVVKSLLFWFIFIVVGVAIYMISGWVSN